MLYAGDRKDDSIPLSICIAKRFLCMQLATIVVIVLGWKRFVSFCFSERSDDHDTSSSLWCVSDRNCSCNGLCSIQQDSCLCDTGWQGRYCHALDLLPLSNGTGLEHLLRQTRTSTWGGSVIYHRGSNLTTSGLYHMWYSQIQHHCGIHRWVSNSVIRHATSRGVVDGWTFTPTASTDHHMFDIFSHEPIVVKDPTTEEYGLFLSHYPDGPATNDRHVCYCTDGNSASAKASHCRVEEGLGDENQTMLTYFTYTTSGASPQGPWKQPLLSLGDVTPSDQQKVDLNFAPVILANGSLVAWSRWDIWIAHHNWKDPSRYRIQGQAPDFNDPNGAWEGEDPSLWVDKKGRFHILSHNGARGEGGTDDQPKGDCGRHLFSESGKAGTWVMAPLPLGGCAYPRVNVTYRGGDRRSFYRRERPHLILDEWNRPIALSTAVIDSPTGPNGNSRDGRTRDASYTLIQEIAS